MKTATERRALIMTTMRAPGGTARSKLVQVIISSLGTLIVLLVCVVVGMVMAWQLVTLARTALSPISTANRAILQTMTDSQSNLRGYQLTNDPDFLKSYRDAQAPLAEALDSLDAASVDDPEMQRLATAERQAVTVWRDSYAQAATAGPVPDAVEQTGNTAFEAFRSSSVDVSTALRTRSYAWLDQASKVVLITLVSLVVVLIVGTVFSLVPAVRALRQIGPPLEALETTVDRIRAGDSGARADPGLGVREIQAVSLAVNELAAEHQRRQERDTEDIRLGTAARVVSSATNSSLDLADIGQRSIEAIADQFDAAVVALRAFEGGAELPGPAFSAVHPQNFALKAGSDLVDTVYQAVQSAWRSQTHLLISSDARVDTDVFAAADLDRIRRLAFEGTGLATFVLIPLGVGPECLGYLSASRVADQPGWSEPEIDALMAAGQDIGRAIVHARLLERETVLVSELKLIDAKKSDFVSMVSHELRTPLASIIGHLEIVRTGDRDLADPETDSSLQAIDRNAMRLTTLIEDLLLLSRIEQRKRAVPTRPVDLVAVAAEVTKMHTEPAASRDITLRLFHEGTALVAGDELELERIVSNLIGNAIKYSPPHSAVSIAVAGTADTASVAVADQGIGLSEADRQRLFERFFRSNDPAAQSVPGTGLGLAISKLLVDNHGGTIEVSSELRRGSVFTVTLPKLSGAERSADDDLGPHPDLNRSPALTHHGGSVG